MKCHWEPDHPKNEKEKHQIANKIWEELESLSFVTILISFFSALLVFFFLIPTVENAHLRLFLASLIPSILANLLGIIVFYLFWKGKQKRKQELEDLHLSSIIRHEISGPITFYAEKIGLLYQKADRKLDTILERLSIIEQNQARSKSTLRSLEHLIDIARRAETNQQDDFGSSQKLKRANKPIHARQSPLENLTKKFLGKQEDE